MRGFPGCRIFKAASLKISGKLGQLIIQPNTCQAAKVQKQTRPSLCLYEAGTLFEEAKVLPATPVPGLGSTPPLTSLQPHQGQGMQKDLPVGHQGKITWEKPRLPSQQIIVLHSETVLKNKIQQ